MARGGISKYLVANARERLLAVGVHPSIDAVRKELGDTGSKTTIHRYLKEIEESECVQLADEALLSSSLKALIAKMVAQLRQDAVEIVDQEKQKHELIESKLKERINQKQVELTNANTGIAHLEKRLEALQSNSDKLGIVKANQLVDIERFKQKLSDQEEIISNQKAHLESLEEKNLHARESLEHYRASVKEQRDQDVRTNGQIIQQLHVDTRELRQTISIKQSELTLLNTDNAKLITQLSDANKHISRLEKKDGVIQAKLDLANKHIADREALLSFEQDKNKRINADNDALEKTIANLSNDLQAKLIELASLESSLATKNGLLEQLVDKIKSSSQSDKQLKT